MSKIDQLEKRIKDLERKICCKTQFFNTVGDLPAEGNEGVIYVTDDGNIYVWNGVEYVTQLSISLTEPITEDTTLTIDHANKYIPVNSVIDTEITISPNIFSTNDQIVLEQTGAGKINLIADIGMTLNGNLNSIDQYYILTIFFKSATVATVIGGEV